MNIIKTYIENIFVSLPNTKEVNKMKHDLLLNMEEKYLELKKNGKTENEAIGIVISEFGNIEELANELGVSITHTEENKETIISVEEAKDYMTASKKNGFKIALGVFLVLIGISIFITYLNQTTSSGINTFLGFIILFGFIAAAVGLFIYAGINLSKFEYLKSNVIINNNIKEVVKLEKKNFDSKFTIGLIISVTLFIFSPIPLIFFSVINDDLGIEKYDYVTGISILLLMIAIGCLIIISLGMIKDSHNVLLQIENYTKEKKKEDKIINAIAGIYWPFVTAGYLLWSFLGEAWHISWLIWPIAGVLFGGVSGIIHSTSKSD